MSRVQSLRLVYEVSCVHVSQTGLWRVICHVSQTGLWSVIVLSLRLVYVMPCAHVSRTGLLSAMCPCLPNWSRKCYVSMSHILAYEVLYIYMSLSMYVRTTTHSVCVSHIMCACPCTKRHVPWLCMNCYVSLCMHELSRVPACLSMNCHTFLCMNCHVSVSVYELSCVPVCVWTVICPWLCMNIICPCLCMYCHVSVSLYELSCIRVCV